MDRVKMHIAKKQMLRIPVVYEQLMRLHPDGMPSLGMVAVYDRIGGRSGRNTSIVENVAMKDLSLTETQKELLSWLDAVNQVYSMLVDGTGKNGPKAVHDKMLANVLRCRVYTPMTFDRIRQLHFRQGISVQYVQKLYDDCVELVAIEAEKRGLYKASA